MSRSLPDEAYTEGQCDIHGQVVFVDIMGDDFCMQCFADQQKRHTHTTECYPEYMDSSYLDPFPYCGYLGDEWDD